MKRLRSLFAALLLVVLFVPATVAQTSTPTGACGLVAPAFCDTFDAPVGGAERSGDLNSVVWGASRVSSNDNLGQGSSDNWADAALDLCGTSVTAQAGTGQDVRICDGKLVDAVNDNHQSAVLAMYPRQPFDIAGRTGTVAFDVSALSQGPHAEWPAFLYTDQPVPAPDGELNNQPAIDDRARNSFGFGLAELCGAGAPCWPPPGIVGTSCVTVNEMWVTRNYAASDLAISLPSCVQEATPGGPLNHFQVRLSQGQVQVWGTDPGATTFREIAVATNANLPLTRGLVWMEDVHYNANKFNTQGNATIAWDNFGFDGPVLTRDLGVELPDNTQRVGGASTNLGWAIPQTGSALTKTFAGTSNVAGASAALLEFTTNPAKSGDTFSYTVNGHAALTATPTTGAYSQQTVVLPVPVSDLQDGGNTLTISDDQESVDAANFDLILVGAGQQPPTATATPAPTTTAVPTTTPTPVASETASTTSASSTATVTTTQTVTSTVTQTVTETASTSFSLSCTRSGAIIACTGQ